MDDSEQIIEDLGKRIREVRIQRKMSQQELAANANISLPHISDIEHGKKAMKLLTFIRIVEALHVSADYLLQPDVFIPDQKTYNEFSRIIDDCSTSEIEALKKLLLQMKETMRNAQRRE